jgi:hypothetical protein
MKLGEGKLPPFVGYLPPATDGVLLELVNMSYPDYPPRRGRTGAQLSQDRKLAIDTLRIQFKQRPHRRALEILAGSMRRRTPFCLYLRNFGLGARTYKAGDDPFGLPQAMTAVRTGFDNDIQRRIETIVAPRVPAVCIWNSAEPFSVLPGFIVGDEEWEELAHTLVRNAGLIVLYFLSLTTAVAEELNLIRSENRQEATVIVIEEGDPFEDRMGTDAMFRVRRNEPPRSPAIMDDFPHQVRRRADDVSNVVDLKLTEMMRGSLRPPVDQRIGVPGELVPPEELVKFCTDMATHEHDAAMMLIDEKRFEEAEDVLTRAIAYAHWGRDTLGRAVTLFSLAGLNLTALGAKGDVGDYLEMVVDIADEIRAESPTAAKLYEAAGQQLKILRAEAEGKARASRTER